MNKISSDKKNRNIVYFTLGEKIVKKTKKGSKKKREVTPPPTPPPVKKSSKKSNGKVVKKPEKSIPTQPKKEVKKTKEKKPRKPSVQPDDLFKWGFTLTTVYRTAVRFYKDKEGRAFNLAYDDKEMIVTFNKL